MEDLLRNVCADCSEEQRNECKKTKVGCDKYHNFIDSMLEALNILSKEDDK